MALVVQPFVLVLGIVPIISYLTRAAAGAGLFMYVCVSALSTLAFVFQNQSF